uniref:EF-hand domain-containing protein n=1 Tax=Panagrolaimus superbus TaxID=310955 RepID=A0A914Z3V1_9BILA
MHRIFWICYFCFGFSLSSVFTSPSILPIIAHQKFTGESLPSCSISSFIYNETVDERFFRLDRSRRYRLSFSDFLFADQCAIKNRRENFNKIDINFDGFLDKREFDIWARKLDFDKRKEKLDENRKLFEFFDKDSNSKLDERELRKYIRFLRCNPTNVKYFLRDKEYLDFKSFDAFTYTLPNALFPLGRRNRTTPKKPDFGEGNCQKPETHFSEFLRIDSDRNKKIDFEEFLRFERCAILRHKRKFSKMDFNGDGNISLHEFRRFYSDRDHFWKRVYDMRMNGVVHKYDKNGDMKLNRNELKNYLSDKNLDDRNIDFFLRGKNHHLNSKQFADWEETLPNSLFPLLLLKPKQLL